MAKDDMTIPLTGSIPGLINENTPLWDWMGQLRLGIDPALIRFVEITGTGADYFDAMLNRATGMITIAPIAQADYEAFSASGRSPTLSLGLRFFMADGTVQTSASNYGVTVLNLDDTAPQSLRFSSGGKVEAKQAGAVIGTLAVTDPDTISGFTYTVREDDQWLFEIVNGVLKLRSGVSLSVTDGPSRPVVIEVSDGTQSSAFSLDVTVQLPGSTGGQGIDLFESHERRDGFYWTGIKTMVGDHMSYEIASLKHQGDFQTLLMRDGTELIFNTPDTLQLLDGTVYYGAVTPAGWIWNAYQATLHRDPSNWEMFAVSQILDKTYSQKTFFTNLIQSQEFQQKYGVLNNQQFVERLYLNSSGVISSSGTAYYAARLDAGYDRADLVKDFMYWRMDTLGLMKARAEDGIFIPKANAQIVDFLYHMGGGYEPLGDFAWWSNAISTGLATGGELAQNIVASPGYAARWGNADNRTFVTQFFTEAVGKAPDVGLVDFFTGALDAGWYSRASYMLQVAANVPGTDSYVYQRPDGTAFVNPW